VVFFLSLLIDGALAGAVYALIALAFVLVYKASRTINFAIGEWVMWGALLVAVGMHTIGLGLGAAIVFACAGMVALAFAFSRLVLRRMAALPVIASIMVTLGLGAVMRGIGAVIFTGLPSGISLPIPADPIAIGGVRVATDKLAAALVAALCIALLGAFYRYSRRGLALQALADDRQTAMSVGIDVDRHLLIVWGIAGVISVAAGVLWTFVSGGGFGGGQSSEFFIYVTCFTLARFRQGYADIWLTDVAPAMTLHPFRDTCVASNLVFHPVHPAATESL